jgi:hypothetical protein
MEPHLRNGYAFKWIPGAGAFEGTNLDCVVPSWVIFVQAESASGRIIIDLWLRSSRCGWR